jgi:FkbM family methyltransferase
LEVTLLGKLHHYAHAVETRLFQLYELSLLRREGVRFDAAFYRQLLKRPGKSEDWVNLARFLKPAEKVALVDIGANVGDFTAEFLSFYPRSSSVCFEPVQSTYNHLRNRFAHDPRVQVHHCAISDSDGTAKIHLHEDSTLCSLGQYMGAANDFYESAGQPSEETVCKRLDEFELPADRQRLLIKIDVQGFEGEVIRGGMNTLRQADVVLLECSFADEYVDKEPSFAPSCAALRECGLYPIVFQDFGRALSNYAFERDVIFVKRELLDRIWLRKARPQSTAAESQLETSHAQH